MKTGVSCGLRDREGGGGQEPGGAGGERVLFFARKQMGDILKEGAAESLRASVCPLLEAFGSWESVFLVTRGFEHGGLSSWLRGCGRGEAVGARMLPGPADDRRPTTEGSRQLSCACACLFEAKRHAKQP